MLNTTWAASMRAADFPIPDYALYVWHRGDAICVALPDYGETANERTLIVPLSKLPGDAPGWKFLLDLLRDRKMNYDQHKPNTFSTRAEPTSVQVKEAMLAYNARKRAEKEIHEDIFNTGDET